METSNITEIINDAVTAAIKAASKDGNKVTKQPAFWITICFISFIVFTEICFTIRHNTYGNYIANSLIRERHPEVRAYLLKEKTRISLSSWHMIIYPEIPEFEMEEARDADKAQKTEEARRSEETVVGSVEESMEPIARREGWATWEEILSKEFWGISRPKARSRPSASASD